MKIQIVIFSIIVVILALTALFAFIGARTEAENRQVVLDASKIAEALEIYKTENGFYPPNREVLLGMPEYLSFWPTPATAGKCQNFNAYTYDQKSNGENFGLTFCLTAGVMDLSAGMHTVNREGL